MRWVNVNKISDVRDSGRRFARKKKESGKKEKERRKARKLKEKRKKN